MPCLDPYPSFLEGRLQFYWRVSDSYLVFLEGRIRIQFFFWMVGFVSSFSEGSDPYPLFLEVRIRVRFSWRVGSVSYPVFLEGWIQFFWRVGSVSTFSGGSRICIQFFWMVGFVSSFSDGSDPFPLFLGVRIRDWYSRRIGSKSSFSEESDENPNSNHSLKFWFGQSQIKSKKTYLFPHISGHLNEIFVVFWCSSLV